MSGPKPRTVAFQRSGWIAQPPISREEAANNYGQEIPDAVWSRILLAFDEFGRRCDTLAGPRVNNNRKDDRSYPIARDRAEASLEEAFALVDSVRSDYDMVRAMCMASMANPSGAVFSLDLDGALNSAEFAILAALRMVKAAATPPTVNYTMEDAQKRLGHDIRNALIEHGLDGRLTGWSEANFADPLSEADLTPAERLISALGVHVAASPSALARWLRGAKR